MTNRIWDFDVSVIYEPMLSIWTELGENWVQEAEKNERGGLKSTRETTGKPPPCKRVVVILLGLRVSSAAAAGAPS